VSECVKGGIEEGVTRTRGSASGGSNSSELMATVVEGLTEGFTRLQQDDDTGGAKSFDVCCLEYPWV